MTDASQGPFFIPDIPTIPAEGKDLPAIGIRTPIVSTKLDPSAVKSAILYAIQLGYRHLQTNISSYLEQIIGEAVVQAVENGLVNSREELYISSKIQHSDAGFDAVVLNLKKFLEKLNLEYVDLYIFEWPGNDKQEKEELDEEKAKLAWEAMEECQKLGLAKSIGVCNFSSKMLESLLKFAKIPPSVNQVEMHNLWSDKKLKEFSLANKIAIVVSSTIDVKENHSDFTEFMEAEVLNKIEKTQQKTPAQVYFRWAYEQGAALLLESLNMEHMKEIIDIFTWKISEEI